MIIHSSWASSVPKAEETKKPAKRRSRKNKKIIPAPAPVEVREEQEENK